jgi:hypothetical protein
MKQYTLIAFLVLLAHPCSASWNWYAGDLVSYTLYPPDQLAHHFQAASDTQLDYRIFYAPPAEGHFVGLADFLREEEFNAPTACTPILGTAVMLDPTHTVVCIGVDPRSPIPKTTPEELNQWATSQGGIAIVTALPDLLQHPHMLPNHTTLFQALDTKGWHSDCEMGGKWDSLLTLGHRIGIVGSSISHTYVWAETTQPHHLFAGFNNMATVVAEANGIVADFRVDEHIPGSVVLPGAQVSIRLLATAREPIQSIRLIANGQVIWSTTPNTNTFSTRLQIALTDKRYLRAEFQTESHHTRTSPIFFAPEFDPEPMDLSFEHLPLHLTWNSVVESLTSLPIESQARILAEYISHEQTRFAMTMALESRTDILSNPLIEALSESPFPQVRLGAAFLRVMQNESTLSGHLLQLLSDPDPAIQTYAARMLLQYTPFQSATQLKDRIDLVDAHARTYLIQALDPAHLDQTLYQSLIHATRTPKFGIASAATAKLVEMGTRNFKVIKSLRDSAYTGHITCLEILGAIGDERVLDDIEKIYNNAAPSPLKNAAFRVLQTFFPQQDHYPNRPEVHDEGALPLLDGLFSKEEWKGSAHMDHFVDDAHMGQTYKGIEIYVTRNETHLLFAIQMPKNSTHPPQHLEFSLATTLAPQIPFVFAIHYPTTTETPLDPTLQVIQSITDTAWIVEGGIGLNDLGLDPTAAIPYLRFNASLVSDTNRWSWTPTYGMPDNPDRFGILHLHTPH